MPRIARAAAGLAKLIAVACWLATGASSSTLAADPAATGASAGMAVTVTRAKKTCFTDTLQVTGILVPREEVLVRPDVEGYRVSRIEVEDGDRVTAGQTLARLAREAQGGQPAATATVQAPVAGIVGSRMIRIGMMASARAEPLFRIIVGGEMELEAEVPAPRIGKLAPEQIARIAIAGARDVLGRVRLIAPEIDAATQLGRARVSLRADQKVEAGTFAKATVEVGQSCGSTVPLAAVLYRPEGGAMVQAVRADRIETRPVRVGLISGGNVEIREGLNEGDMVVARAGAFLREGDRIRPILIEGSAAGPGR